MARFWDRRRPDVGARPFGSSNLAEGKEAPVNRRPSPQVAGRPQLGASLSQLRFFLYSIFLFYDFFKKIYIQPKNLQIYTTTAK